MCVCVGALAGATGKISRNKRTYSWVPSFSLRSICVSSIRAREISGNNTRASLSTCVSLSSQGCLSSYISLFVCVVLSWCPCVPSTCVRRTPRCPCNISRYEDVVRDLFDKLRGASASTASVVCSSHIFPPPRPPPTAATDA